MGKHAWSESLHPSFRIGRVVKLHHRLTSIPFHSSRDRAEATCGQQPISARSFRELSAAMRSYSRRLAATGAFQGARPPGERMLEMKAIARNAQYATAQFFKAHDALAVLPAPYAAATTRHVSNEIYHSGGTKRARPLWLLAMDGGQVLCKSALPGVRAIACFSGESIGLLRSSSRAAVLKGHCKIQPRREILGVDVQGDFKGAACTFRGTGS